MAHILIVEDEPNVRKLIQITLEREGLTPVSCDNGETALELISQNEFDLIILDWMIKGALTGLDLCKTLSGKVPILMVTARSTVTEIVLGLEMGADDYLTKPFEIPVLLARVRALLRRHSKVPQNNSSDIFIFGDLKINSSRVEVFCQKKEIKLTASEFKILISLAKKQGSVLARSQLLTSIQDQGVAGVTDRIVDTHIYSLRNKLGECGHLIETIRGIGYRIKT